MADTQIKTARWVKVILAISLTLNLLVVGLIGGIIVKGRDFRDRQTPVDGMLTVTRAMPREYQGNVRQQIRDRFDEVRASREAMARLRADLAAALIADPFDVTAVEEIFQRQRDVLMGLTGAGHDIVLEQIEMMSAEDRATYAHNLLNLPDNPGPPPRDR